VRSCSVQLYTSSIIGKCKVGQNHTFIRIYGVHTVFLTGTSPYIRSYTVYIRFWPTLEKCCRHNRCFVGWIHLIAGAHEG